jgi:serine/threonine-protein kinase
MEPGVAEPSRSSCPVCRAVFRGGFLRCPRDGAELGSAEVDPLVGTVLVGRYQIESVIGEGGIGRVYRARHTRMSRRYAIKVPFGELGYDTKVRQRFLQEAEATSRLQHPNVIGVVDVGETEAGLLYMAMDLAEGTSLAEVVARGPIGRDRALGILAQIAEGLGHAHGRGLIHRDLKPENIILERDAAGGDRVRIVDFGIAILRDAEGQSGRLTTEGIVLGTPHYMAPEQATAQEIDHRTDLFALGLILYEMLAGVLPFDGTPVEVARKNLGAEVPRITSRVPGLVVDRHLEALAFWLLEKKPAARPQSAAEVVETIRLIQSDPAAASARLRIGEVEEIVEQGLAPKLPPPVAEELSLATERTPAPRRRLAIALVLALAAVIAVIAVMLRSDDAPARAAAPPDAAAVAVAAPPPDAGVVTEIAVDAAVAAVEVDAAVAAPDARPVRRPDPVVRKAPTPDAGPDPKTEEPAPSQASLTALYDQVGRQLNAAIAARGKDETAAFARRYQDIPYLEAIRKPALRAQAMKQLRALSRDLGR